METKTLKLSRNDIVRRIFDQYDENAPNGVWELKIPLGIVHPEETTEVKAEFLQDGSWIPVENRVCEIPVSDLVEIDDFYADSLSAVFNFPEARSDGRIDAEKEGLDAVATGQKIRDYEDNARSYADEAIRAMLVDMIVVDEKEFRIEWVD